MNHTLTIDTATLNAWDTLQALKHHAKDYPIVVVRDNILTLVNDLIPIQYLNAPYTIYHTTAVIEQWQQRVIDESNPAYDIDDCEDDDE